MCLWSGSKQIPRGVTTLKAALEIDAAAPIFLPVHDEAAHLISQTETFASTHSDAFVGCMWRGGV